MRDFDFELLPDATLEEIESNKDLVRDITDVPVALSAINGNADCIVTHDNDFLVEDDTTERLHNLIRIYRPIDFLSELGVSQQELAEIQSKTWREG